MQETLTDQMQAIRSAYKRILDADIRG
jgi:hypothetical protein